MIQIPVVLVNLQYPKDGKKTTTQVNGIDHSQLLVEIEGKWLCRHYWGISSLCRVNSKRRDVSRGDGEGGGGTGGCGWGIAA